MCSEGKYELQRASGQEKGRKSLAKKEKQTERNTAADFIFSGGIHCVPCRQPHNLKVRNSTTHHEKCETPHHNPKERIWKKHLISKKN